jgi:outer membrane protein assembly factor BamE (lipoprotein component of BamABCDE complex)
MPVVKIDSKFMKKSVLVFALCAVFLANGCTRVENVGYSFNDDASYSSFAHIKSLEYTKSGIVSEIGSPTFVLDEKWYYVGSQRERVAFFLPKITQHHMLEISFDGERASDIRFVSGAGAFSYPQKAKIKLTKPTSYLPQ